MLLCFPACSLLFLRLEPDSKNGKRSGYTYQAKPVPRSLSLNSLNRILSYSPILVSLDFG